MFWGAIFWATVNLLNGLRFVQISRLFAAICYDLRMRCLSVRQPWAELIASGRKSVEVRSWTTSYRGPLLICAGVAWHQLGVELHGRLGQRGCAVCLVWLVDIRPLVDADSDAARLDARDFAGQFAWVLRSPERVEPLEMSGRLGLFTPAVVPPRRVA